MKSLALALCLCSLLGCASRSAAPAQKVPPSRRYDTSLLRRTSHRNCALTVVREPGVKGYGINVYLDGDQIARISAGESATVYITPRRHQLTIRPLFSPVASKRLELRKGEATTIRIVDRDSKFQLVTADRQWLATVGQSVSSWAKHPFGSHGATGE